MKNALLGIGMCALSVFIIILFSYSPENGTFFDSGYSDSESDVECATPENSEIYTEEVSFVLENESNTVIAPDESMEISIENLTADQKEVNTYGELLEVESTIRGKVNIKCNFESDTFKPYLAWVEYNNNNLAIDEHFFEIRKSYLSDEDKDSFKLKKILTLHPETAKVAIKYGFIGERTVEENSDKLDYYF